MSHALIIGYGSTLRGDDGLGPFAAEHLSADLVPAGQRIACYELTPELAAPISRAGLVVFVDASGARRPGDIACEPLAPVPPGEVALSHAFSPALLLALARDLYGACPPAWLVSVGAASFDFAEEPSPAVRAALPALRERLRSLIAGEGRVTDA